MAGIRIMGIDAVTGQKKDIPTLGISVTITTAPLTNGHGGATGSMTFLNGILTDQTQAT